MSKELGSWGEAIARRHYEDLGYTVLDNNWHCRFGEIDLVCSRGDEIVFVEVKTRSSLRFGAPEEGLSERQQLKIQKAAWTYLSENNLLETDWHIDVVAIERDRGGAVARLDRYQDAVQAQPLD